YARLARHVAEGSVSVVAIEKIGAEVRHVKVEIAVTVVVAHSSAHPIADAANAGLLGDVAKQKLAIGDKFITKQPVSRPMPLGRRELRLRSVFGRVEHRALRQVDIK